MKFASAVFGGRKLNAVRADAMRRDAAPMICAVFYGASGRCASALYKPGPIVIGCRAEGCGGSQMARGRSGPVWLYRLFKSITSVFRGCPGIDFVTFLST